MMCAMRKAGVLSILFVLVPLAVAVIAEAQQTGKIAHIGFLDSSTASGSAVLLDAFWQEMHKLGWIEGKNITIEYRFAEQKSDRKSTRLNSSHQIISYAVFWLNH